MTSRKNASSRPRAKDAIGRFAFSGFVLVTALIYVMNLNAPPPPNWQVVSWSGVALWLFVLWAAWADRHREVSSRGVVAREVGGASSTVR